MRISIENASGSAWLTASGPPTAIIVLDAEPELADVLRAKCLAAADPTLTAKADALDVEVRMARRQADEAMRSRTNAEAEFTRLQSGDAPAEGLAAKLVEARRAASKSERDRIDFDVVAELLERLAKRTRSAAEEPGPSAVGRELAEAFRSGEVPPELGTAGRTLRERVHSLGRMTIEVQSIDDEILARLNS